MAILTVSTPAPLGPLSVELYSNRGQRLGKGFTLSSSVRAVHIPDLLPGAYTVVATRPSGERIVAEVKIARTDKQVNVLMRAGSPDQAQPAAERFGLSFTSPRSGQPSAGLDSRAGGLILDSLNALHKPSVSAQQRAVFNRERRRPADVSAGAATVNFASVRLTDAEPFWGLFGEPGQLNLTSWALREGRWERIFDHYPFEVVEAKGDFLRLSVHTKEPLSVGLMNDQGFGPVIVVPHFTEGTELSFIAAGVGMSHRADRVANPSALRVPVAIAVPKRAEIADLLVGLAAPSLPNALSVMAGTGDSLETALTNLYYKFEDPAAAVLGALFLARFAPSRLPLDWLRNLAKLLPDIGDTHLLLAWARAANGDGDYEWPDTITGHLRSAAASRCLLFDRSRSQLTQMSRLYGPYPRARQDKVSSPRKPRSGDFLDYAAEAGGLAAFWGVSPLRPGTGRSVAPKQSNIGIAVKLVNGQFV